MSLLAALTRAKTEEDVKDAYIAALGLKGVYKGLVDIQTHEIWFEAKETPTPPLLMFAQLLVYVRAGLCCTNPVRDSSRESSVVAGGHEQTHPSSLQDQELAGL